MFLHLHSGILSIYYHIHVLDRGLENLFEPENQTALSAFNRPLGIKKFISPLFVQDKDNIASYPMSAVITSNLLVLACILADSGLFLDFLYQGGVKSTVSGLFGDLNSIPTS